MYIRKLIALAILSYATQASALNLDILLNGILTKPEVRKLVTSAQTLMTANISPAGTLPGTVIASPSQSMPDYYYMWIRDAALTMEVVTDRPTLLNYADLSLKQQQGPAIAGLGEPKFNVDGTDFTGPWGRPQNDGPALRAVTAIKLANALIAEGQMSYVQTKLYDGRLPSQSLIKNDLEYVAAHWRDANVDLWEESTGQHFYTLMAQRNALLLGSTLANQLNDTQAAAYYSEQAQNIEDTLPEFWDDSRGYILTVLDQTNGPNHDSGLDVSVILAALHSTQGEQTFGVTDDRILATAYNIQQAFAGLYAINQQSEFQNLGTAIGRYPEDQYNGTASTASTLANPWFLATAAYAELFYRASGEFKLAGEIEISDLNKPFFESLHSLNGATLNVGDIYRAGDAMFTEIVNGLVTDGDRFIARVRFHANGDSLSEQYDRDNGFEQGAHDLTWSYASLITALNARPQ